MTADTELHEKDLVLEITRHFDVPREVLFRAWTDPSWLVRWMGPGECTCPVAETEIVIGGAFKICIRGEGDHWAHGHYQEIEPPERLAFSWQWEQEDGSLGHEMLIEIDFVKERRALKCNLGRRSSSTMTAAINIKVAGRGQWSVSRNCLPKPKHIRGAEKW